MDAIINIFTSLGVNKTFFTHLSIVVVLAVARFLFHYLPIFCQPYLSMTLHDVGKIRLVTM